VADESLAHWTICVNLCSSVADAVNKRLHAIVRGRVQMVGFRYFVEEAAHRLGIAGWVRNGDDGASVEVVAEGAEDLLRRLEAALRQGPPHARVEAVEATWSDAPEGHRGFQVRL
jgi:acylphosphatase